MTTAATERLATPSGLTREELELLSTADKRRLATWHAGKAGDDDGRPWWPWAIRSLPLEVRMALATDVEADIAWMERETRRVEASAAYLTSAYGHVQDEEGDTPAPFILWPEQEEVIEALVEELRVIILKARQLGLTWIALHYAVHHMAFDPNTARANVLALSKDLDNAKKLLKRARRIVKLLPPYLRIPEDRETRDSLTEYKLVGRGRMLSLTSSPSAARSETATLFLWDEAAWPKNRVAGPIWTAAAPTLGRKGKAIIISSGNGPAEQPGDGQAFAKLWQRATSGTSEFKPIFLPSTVDPRRDEAFHKARRAEALSEAEYLQEYPASPDDALAGVSQLRVYSASAIAAASRLAKELQARPPDEPVDGGVILGCDWGMNMHALILWPLERGGFWVRREVVHHGDELEPVVEKITAALKEVGQPVIAQFFDAAEPQVNAALMAMLRPRINQPHLKARKVPFGQYKRLGISYVQYLLARAEKGETPALAVDTEKCAVLHRQMLGLEYDDDGSGKIAKSKGEDHGPDALVAGAVPTAIAWRKARGELR